MRSFLLAMALTAAAGCASRPDTAASPPEPPAATRSGYLLDPARVASQSFEDYDSPPRMLRGRAPIYPIELALSGVSGSATISYLVGIDGKARQFETVAASNPHFANHAIIAVQQWTFAPALRQGVAVAARVKQTFEFAPP